MPFPFHPPVLHPGIFGAVPVHARHGARSHLVYSSQDTGKRKPRHWELGTREVLVCSIKTNHLVTHTTLEIHS